MDTDLPEDTITGVNKAMRRIRGNDDDASGVNLARIIANGHCGGEFRQGAAEAPETLREDDS